MLTEPKPSLRALAALVLAAFVALPALADERVRVCYNYGCNAEANVVFGDADLDGLRAAFAGVQDAAAEREVLSLAIARMYVIAGQQSPIWTDKGGDVDDDDGDGRMDCIDHMTTTTSFLLLLDRLDVLNHHYVLGPLRRGIVVQHWAARIAQSDTREEFIVDSWFQDHGHPAVIMTREAWRGGATPARIKPAERNG